MSQSDSTRPRRPLRSAALLALALSLSACATSSNPKDPYEKFNRAMFSFNDAIDQAALKPAATAYKAMLPSFVQHGVGNFFGNLADVWSAVNNLLQGKGEDGLNDVTRVALNSTFGIAGLIDIASDAGLRKHGEDFGQTLGVWGIGPGPYLMLPLLGPSTVRDTVALPLDWKGDPWNYHDPVRARNIGTGVRIVDQRAVLLDASNLMEEAALDRYEFVRDSFLQRRESRINDGDDAAKRKFRLFNIGNRAPEPKEADPGPTDVAAPVSSETAAKELTAAPVTATPSGSQPGK